MRAVILLVGVTCFGLINGVSYAEVILDFNSLPTSPDGGVSAGPELVDQGFRLSTIYTRQRIDFVAFEDGWQNGRGSSNGSTTVCVYDMSEEVAFRLTHADGNPFRLISIDLAESLQPTDFWSALVADSVVISGQKADTSQVSLTFDLDKANDGPGGAADFETLAFSSSWDDLLAVTFTARNLNEEWTYVNFDNIRLQAGSVPEPASFLLFLGSGALAALVLSRRCRRGL